jgi:hypothetical protein
VLRSPPDPADGNANELLLAAEILYKIGEGDRERLRKRREVRLQPRIVFCAPHEHSDTPWTVALLRPRRERPRRSAAEECDEVSPFHVAPKARGFES